jgi:outer membrane immunogenic protein
VAALALGFLTTGASADANDSDAFTGLYLGVHGNWDTGDYSGELLDFNDDYRDRLGTDALENRALGAYPERTAPPYDGVESVDLDGFGVGLHVGYLFELNNRFRFGVETSMTFGGPDGLERIVHTADEITEALPIQSYRDIETEVSFYGSARGRLGVVVDTGQADSSLMPYIHAGFAVAEIESRIDFFSRSRQLISKITDLETREFGYTIGAGLEYAFADNWVVRAEYAYNDFGNMDWRYEGSITQALVDAEEALAIARGRPQSNSEPALRASFDGFDVEDFTFHSFSVGISYHF